MSLVLAADYRVPDFDHWWAGAGSVCGRCGHTIRTMIQAAAAAADPPSRIPDRPRRRWGRPSSRDLP